MRQVLIVICLATSLSACGGGGSGSGGPTGPSATTTSVVVTLRDVVLVGTTAVASATATLSNGQTQAVVSGWRSDAPAIASVTDGGTVTGVANGEATIIASSGGREGTKRIRVAPNYAGSWQGSQVITSCTATGDLAGLCDDDFDVVGLSFPIGLVARQPGDLSVSGEFSIEDLQFPTFSAQVEGAGGLRFSSVTTVEGVRAEASWQINSSENGRAMGTIREVYSVPGVLAGELTYESRLGTFARSASTLGVTRDGRRKLPDFRRLFSRADRQ